MGHLIYDHIKRLTTLTSDYIKRLSLYIYIYINCDPKLFNGYHLVDASKHELTTSDGKSFRYRYLCLCHGARPKVIDASNPYILGIRDTESVQHFQERLSGSRRIAVVGNGGIATEIVHELKGIDIVWAIKVEIFFIRFNV